MTSAPTQLSGTVHLLCPQQLGLSMDHHRDGGQQNRHCSCNTYLLLYAPQQQASYMMKQLVALFMPDGPILCCSVSFAMHGKGAQQGGSTEMPRSPRRLAGMLVAGEWCYAYPVVDIYVSLLLLAHIHVPVYQYCAGVCSTFVCNI